MRHTYLRGHTNILKQVLVHPGTFNLGLLMRPLVGVGTLRGLQDRAAAVLTRPLVGRPACTPPRRGAVRPPTAGVVPVQL
jgi:hypothetical protein